MNVQVNIGKLLEQILSIYTFLDLNPFVSILTCRNASDKRIVSDPLKKDHNMAVLWEVFSTKYFSPVTEKLFQTLEKLYDPAFASQASDEDFDPNDQEKLLQIYNNWVIHPASSEPPAKSVGRPTNSDIAFLHYDLACIYYYPLLMMNPYVVRL